jgi:hypothetical protein
VKRGWANGVGASVGMDVSDLQMFEVSIDLTEEVRESGLVDR